MGDNERRLNRLSNWCFVLLAVSIIVPAALIFTVIAYQVTKVPRTEKSTPQIQSAPQSTEEDTSGDPATGSEEAKTGLSDRKPSRTWFPVLFVAPMFLLLATTMVVNLGITLGAPAVLGIQARTRRRYDLALAAAAISCGYIPFGTVLGGWALTLLTREPVRALFADRSAAPAPEDDALYLSLLSRCHRVVAALHAVWLAHPLTFVALFFFARNARLDDPTAVFMFLFAGIVGGGVLLWILALCVCTWLAGRYLQERRRRVFCLVVAAVNCMMFPHGTVLGVFTIIVLSRASVQRMFQRLPAQLSPLTETPPNITAPSP